MPEKRHKIRHLEVEIDAEWEISAHSIQQRIEKIINKIAESNLDSIFGNAFSENSLINIQDLELDLGEIEFVEFEEKFEQKLIEELRKKFEQIVTDSNQAEKTGTKIVTEIDALSYALQFGGMPWWYEKSRTESFERVLVRNLKTGKQEVFQMLREISSNPFAIKRLVQILGRQNCPILVRQYFATIASHVLSTINRVFEVEEELKQSQNKFFSFPEEIWWLSFQILLAETAFRLAENEFEQKLLSEFAAFIGISTSQLRSIFDNSAQPKKENLHHPQENASAYAETRNSDNQVSRWLRDEFGESNAKAILVNDAFSQDDIREWIFERFFDPLAFSKWRNIFGDKGFESVLRKLAGPDWALVEKFIHNWVLIGAKYASKFGGNSTFKAQVEFWLISYWIANNLARFDVISAWNYIEFELATQQKKPIAQIQIEMRSIVSNLQGKPNALASEAMPNLGLELPIADARAIPLFAQDLELVIEQVNRNEISIETLRSVLNAWQRKFPILKLDIQEKLIQLFWPGTLAFWRAFKSDFVIIFSETKYSKYASSDFVWNEIAKQLIKKRAFSSKQSITLVLNSFAKSKNVSLQELKTIVRSKKGFHKLKLQGVFDELLFDAQTENQHKTLPWAQEPKWLSQLFESNSESKEIDEKIVWRLKRFINDFLDFYSSLDFPEIEEEEIFSMFWNSARIHFEENVSTVSIIPFLKSFLWEFQQKFEWSFDRNLEKLTSQFGTSLISRNYADDFIAVMLEWLRLSQLKQSYPKELWESSEFDQFFSEDLELSGENLDGFVRKTMAYLYDSNLKMPIVQSGFEKYLLIAQNSPRFGAVLVLYLKYWTQKPEVLSHISAIGLVQQRFLLKILLPEYFLWLEQVFEDSTRLFSGLKSQSDHFQFSEEEFSKSYWLNVLRKALSPSLGQQLKKELIQAAFAEVNIDSAKDKILLAKLVAQISVDLEVLEQIMHKEKAGKQLDSGTMSRFLLEGRLPLGADLEGMRKRLLDSARKYPNETATFLLDFAAHQDVVHRLNLLLPTEAIVELIGIFGSFELQIVKRFSVQIELFVQRFGLKNFGTFHPEILRILLLNSPVKSTWDLLELGFLRLATRLNLSIAKLVTEVVEDLEIDHLAFPELGFVAKSIAKKFGHHPLMRSQSTISSQFQFESKIDFGANPPSVLKADESIIDRNSTQEHHTVDDLGLKFSGNEEVETFKQSASPKIDIISWIATAIEAKRFWQIGDLLSQNEDARKLVFKQIKKDKEAGEELLNQLSLDLILLLLQFRYPNAAQFFEDFELLILQMEKQFGNDFGLNSILRELLLIAIINQGSLVRNLKITLKRAIGSNPERFRAFENELKILTAIFKFPGTVSLLASARIEIRKELASKLNENSKTAKEERKVEFEEMEYDFIVPNAGIAIIGPYISTYFTRLELVKDGKFLGRKEQERAVFLLCYLCNGASSPSLEELTLPKILCGLEAADVLENQRIQIKPIEQELSQSLLTAVINHWPSLGETSVPTFQESFLYRSGQLTRIEANWRLQVEHQAYDLLLKTLPWSLNPLLLPWMKNLMEVIWN